MPTRERLDEFVAAVVSNDHVAAIADFYHEDASMQENLGPRRRGRTLLMEHEAKVLRRVARMVTHPDPVIVLDGDRVAIRWIFDKVDHNGEVSRLEEVALQLWRGDRIAQEQFFYDPTTAWSRVDPEAPPPES
jgi:ketosteroid isomerase-like protein